MFPQEIITELPFNKSNKFEHHRSAYLLLYAARLHDEQQKVNDSIVKLFI